MLLRTVESPLFQNSYMSKSLKTVFMSFSFFIWHSWTLSNPEALAPRYDTYLKQISVWKCGHKELLSKSKITLYKWHLTPTTYPILLLGVKNKWIANVTLRTAARFISRPEHLLLPTPAEAAVSLRSVYLWLWFNIQRFPTLPSP